MQPTEDPSRSVPVSRSRPAPRRRAVPTPAVDAVAWILGITCAAWTRYEFDLTAGRLTRVLGVAVLAAATHAGLAWLRDRYWARHPSGTLQEARALAAVATGTALVMLCAVLPMAERPVPASAPVVGAALALLLMFAVRAADRYRLDRALRPRTGAATRVLIFGAGRGGQRLLRAMLTDPSGRYLPVGLLDDDPGKRHLRLDGVRTLGGRDDIATAVARTGAGTVVFSVSGADPELIRAVRAATLAAGAAFKVMPPIRELVDDRISVAHVREVRIDDLLGRRQVVSELGRPETVLTGRRVLVTGAGGSIGSELCRQILRADPGELMMLDRDESALHSLQLSLSGRAMLDGPELVLADLRDAEGIDRIVRTRRPDVIFHCAALKHLTLLQRHPGEAVRTNVWGTLTILHAARDVGRFVNISTDKAADPISVLGYSKRITERLTAHAATSSPGTFLSVRFGNVFGSRGSVVTAFRSQIEAGLPVTVTHPDVTRYLMSVPEAVHLVLQAAAIGEDGEALVLDMGEPVRIDDLARRLAAEVPDPPEIVYTGLRPGEKLHEALFGAGEVDRRPRHPLISHVPVPALSPVEVAALDPFDDPEKIIAHLARLCAEPGQPEHRAPAGAGPVRRWVAGPD